MEGIKKSNEQVSGVVQFTNNVVIASSFVLSVGLSILADDHIKRVFKPSPLRELARPFISAFISSAAIWGAFSYSNTMTNMTRVLSDIDEFMGEMDEFMEELEDEDDEDDEDAPASDPGFNFQG